jgi:hypothetical protein
MGGLAALLTALFEDDVRAVHAHGMLVGFQSLTDSPFVYVPHDCIVPGALTAGDLCDVAAALAPRPLLFSRLVDGQNREIPPERLSSTLAPAIQSYQAAAASARLSVSETQPAAIGAWLRAALDD